MSYCIRQKKYVRCHQIVIARLASSLGAALVWSCFTGSKGSEPDSTNTNKGRAGNNPPPEGASQASPRRGEDLAQASQSQQAAHDLGRTPRGVAAVAPLKSTLKITPQQGYESPAKIPKKIIQYAARDAWKFYSPARKQGCLPKKTLAHFQRGDSAGKVIFVNASNESISFGGGGMNEVITYLIKHFEPNRQCLDAKHYETNQAVTRQTPGEFAISQHNFGQVYHACAPRGAQGGDLKTLAALMGRLYHNMLKAAAAKMEEDPTYCRIVLCESGTGIFAAPYGGGDCYGAYTQLQFRNAMRQGMLSGIAQAFEQFPQLRQGKVVLNNFDPTMVKLVEVTVYTT